MYKYSDIKTVHLEITTKCNAACPMCLRTVAGGKTNPLLPLTELSLDNIKKIFPPTFIEQLDKMYMCGNYGDPVVATDTLDVFKYFRALNPKIKLSMFSNASARTTAWWQELATVVDEVHFGIDGLKDTNAIYRRNTNFDIIMRNAKSYIEAGGTAVWDYIVFRHNEHQVEEARRLALDMGFKKINIKKTGRFFSNTRSEVKDRQEVLNVSGEVEYYLEMPRDPIYVNSALAKEEALIAKYGHIEKYMDTTHVSCKVAQEKSIYVSADGFVFPCCWTGNQLYPWYYPKRSSQVWTLIDGLKGKEVAISAIETPLETIVEGDFFKSIQNSWELPTVKEGKLRPCAKTCGKEFDPFQEQFR